MIEKFSSPNLESEKNVTINNTRELFIAFTGLKKQKIEEMGYSIKETKQDIKAGVSYYWFVKLTKNGKELTLKGLVDHRFNAGSEPMKITVEKNNFTKEELENFSKISF